MWRLAWLAPSRQNVQSLQKKRPKSGLPGAGMSVKARWPGFGRASFSIYFHFNEWDITKMPNCVGNIFVG
jgi:hypothetical protein